jgi:hypothetical protein
MGRAHTAGRERQAVLKPDNGECRMLENWPEAIPISLVIHSGNITKQWRWDGAGKVIDFAVAKTGPAQVKLNLRFIHLRSQLVGSLYVGQPSGRGGLDKRGIVFWCSQDTSPVTAHERQMCRV